MSHFLPTPLGGLIIIEPTIFSDTRGYFMESYSQEEYREQGITADFVQDNHSVSHRGVIRGLHFQTIHPQAKLIRVTKGSIYDVVVDLRPSSPTYLEWYGLILSAENQRQLFIPRGFAHGLLSLEDDTTCLYKCDAPYHPAGESGIRYDDPELAIDWGEYIPREDIITSPKDALLPTFASFIHSHPL